MDEGTDRLASALVRLQPNRFDGFGESISLALSNELRSLESFHRVLGHSINVELDDAYLGFVDTYLYLSMLIPQHWTVLDLGCSAAPQAWFFRNHKQYVGVDLITPVEARFAFDNTLHLHADLTDYVEQWRGHDLQEVFAICNYVPNWGKRDRRDPLPFSNVFSYYPHGSRTPDPFKLNKDGTSLRTAR